MTLYYCIKLEPSHQTTRSMLMTLCINTVTLCDASSLL